MGYLPLNRKFFDHELWKDKREFSKAEAWLDLLQMVSYEEKDKTLWIQGKPIVYGRGEYPASIRFLQTSWNWGSITKVENFLKYLQKQDMIKLEKRTGQNVITICNYDTYNPIENKKGQQKDTEKDSARTVQGQCKDETNKVITKEVNKGINKEDTPQKSDSIKIVPIGKAPYKNQVRENVLLTPTEEETLIEKYGKEKTEWMLDRLNTYKMANGKTYKSDYGAILSWVVVAMQKDYLPAKPAEQKLTMADRIAKQNARV